MSHDEHGSSLPREVQVADQLAGLCLGTLVLFGCLALLVLSFWPVKLRRETGEL